MQDAETLRYRLEKAELAVEKERRAAQALERQLREGAAAVEEGRTAAVAALEMRRRCDDLERQLARALAESEPEQREAKELAMRAAQEQAAAADAVSLELRREQEEGEYASCKAPSFFFVLRSSFFSLCSGSLNFLSLAAPRFMSQGQVRICSSDH